MMKRSLFVALCAVTACGNDDASTGGSSSAPDAGEVAPSDDSSNACNPPDVLVVLDRTVSMAEHPDGTFPANTAAGHKESKWSIAIDAVKGLSAQLDTTVRFGLALFPKQPSPDVCISLTQRLTGKKALNPDCQAGEVLVDPDASTAATIASALDPETTLLCKSTPIGAALDTARTELAARREAGRPQYVLFVSDGADTCNSVLAIENANALARDGVKTYVVAFDNGAPAGVDRGLLTDMACAGRTAPSFPAGCTADANGDYHATDRTAQLFLTANDAAGLNSTLQQIAGSVCCGCVL